MFLGYESTREKVLFLFLDLILTSIEQPKTEKDGEQTHHTQLKCWEGVHFADHFCP